MKRQTRWYQKRFKSLVTLRILGKRDYDLDLILSEYKKIITSNDTVKESSKKLGISESMINRDLRSLNFNKCHYYLEGNPTWRGYEERYQNR